MTRDIKQAVGKPDNSVFIKRCIIYGIILVLMLFAAPSIFEKLLTGAAVQGILSAWYTIFVPITAIIMAIGLFKCWRRRWSLAYMDNYCLESRNNGYETCPRCGAKFILRSNTSTVKSRVGTRVTTTTHANGTKSVREEGIFEDKQHTTYYHECANSDCGLSPDRHAFSQSHLPWKISEIRALVRSEGEISGKIKSSRSSKSASSLTLSRLLAPFLAIVLVVVGVVLVMNYASWYDGEWTYVTADKQSDRSVEEYQNYLLSLDDEYFSWSFTYEKSPTTMMNYLAKFIKLDKMESYTVGGYNVEGGTIYDYRFEGDDAGTGIPDGWYTLTKLDGINVLIDEDNKTIYKEGTEFYDTYAPKLRELTHDKTVDSILEKTTGGEHAIYNGSVPLEYIQKDNSMVFAYLYSDDTNGNEFRAITTYPEEQMEERWFFYYRTDDYYPDDWEGFTYADDAAFSTDDELGKLMKESSDGSGSVAFCKNDEVVLGISVDYFPNGYDFEIEVAAEGHERGFEEDMVYRVNTTDKTLTKIENYDYSDEIKTDMPLSEHQDKYDFLLSIVPHTYIRRIIDMDKAEVRKESMGLKTIYEMKDENGNVTADMKLAFGKIGEVIHYTGDNEYVQIELEY